MNNHQEKPLITISMMTYNQEKYVRDSVRGMLAQTYEPLEIVISDDCSMDRTWDIISEEVEAYKKNEGLHKNIILNRNEANLGILNNFEKMISLCHGELLVMNSGDDISIAERISRTVEVWIRNGRKAKLIHCGAWKINSEGYICGEVEELTALNPRGACAAYARDVFTTFPLISRRDAYEDRPNACRAIILGTELYLSEKLVFYRIGGISLRLNSKERIKSFRHSLAGMAQNLIDLKYALEHRLIPRLYYDELVGRVMTVENTFSRCLHWLAGNSVRERWHNRPFGAGKVFSCLKDIFKGHLGAGIPLMEMLLILLPFRMGFPLLDMSNSILNRVSRRRRSRMRVLNGEICQER